MQHTFRRPVVGGVALAGASMMIAMSPVGGAPLDVQQRAIRLTSGESDLVQDITIDFVRHGQSFDNLNNIIGTVAPGPTLTPDGNSEAGAIATTLQQEYGSSIAGIYDSGLLRTEETAAPLAALLNMPVQDLSGLNEISAGILEGAHAKRPDGPALPGRSVGLDARPVFRAGARLLRLQRDGVRKLLRRRRPDHLRQHDLGRDRQHRHRVLVGGSDHDVDDDECQQPRSSSPAGGSIDQHQSGCGSRRSARMAGR